VESDRLIECAACSNDCECVVCFSACYEEAHCRV
jgi:hypothetical protein